MKDQNKAEDELERELAELRQRITELEASLKEKDQTFSAIPTLTQAEESLRESEERYSVLFEESRDAIYITSREGEIVNVNQSALDLFGFTKDEIMGLNAAKLYPHPRDRILFQQKIEQNGYVRDYEVKLQKKDGTKMDCLETSSVKRAKDGSILGYQGMIRDITERKQTEAALRESEGKYRALVEKSNDLIYILQGNRFVFVNPQFERTLGYKASELTAEDFDFMQLVSLESRPLIEARAAALERGEEVPHQYIFKALTADGRTLDLEVSAAYIDYQGALATLGVIRDVTEKKQLEAELLQAQKMESLGQMVGGIAHDLNNILTVILSGAQLELHKVEPGSSLALKLKRIVESAQRGADLIGHILAFSRRVEIERKPVDLGSIVEEATQMLKRTIEERVSLLLEVKRPLWTVNADSTQIQQILTNLTLNARDALLEGGEVTFHLTNVALDKKGVRQHPNAKPGDYVRLSVRDTGVGMTPEVRERAYEPFFTTKPPGEGTGLGLSQVHGLVEQHGGFTVIESTRGTGTEVQLYFPAIREQPADVEEKEGEEIPRGSETVLLVEDERNVLQAVREVLESLGYGVLTSRNGEEALEVYREKMKDIALVLTDLVMPVMDGLEFCEVLLKEYPDVKVLSMSGYRSPTDMPVLQKLGVRRHLRKPLDLAILARALRQVLDA